MKGILSKNESRFYVRATRAEVNTMFTNRCYSKDKLDCNRKCIKCLGYEFKLVKKPIKAKYSSLSKIESKLFDEKIYTLYSKEVIEENEEVWEDKVDKAYVKTSLHEFYKKLSETCTVDTPECGLDSNCCKCHNIYLRDYEEDDEEKDDDVEYEFLTLDQYFENESKPRSEVPLQPNTKATIANTTYIINNNIVDVKKAISHNVYYEKCRGGCGMVKDDAGYNDCLVCRLNLEPIGKLPKDKTKKVYNCSLHDFLQEYLGTNLYHVVIKNTNYVIRLKEYDIEIVKDMIQDIINHDNYEISKIYKTNVKFLSYLEFNELYNTPNKKVWEIDYKGNIYNVDTTMNDLNADIEGYCEDGDEDTCIPDCIKCKFTNIKLVESSSYISLDEFTKILKF